MREPVFKSHFKNDQLILSGNDRNQNTLEGGLLLVHLLAHQNSPKQASQHPCCPFLRKHIGAAEQVVIPFKIAKTSFQQEINKHEGIIQSDVNGEKNEHRTYDMKEIA